MKALSAILRFKKLSRGNSADQARMQINRAKVPASPPPSLDSTHEVTKRMIAGFPSYEVTSPHTAPHTTALYVYGGGYVTEISPAHWALIGRLADSGVRVEVPIYGLAPRYGHRDALPFLTAVYERLTAEDPDMPIALIGDSAGGGLALMLAQEVRDLGLPAPCRQVLISPWLDLSLTNPDIAKVERHDPWLCRTSLSMAADAWAQDRSLTHAAVSPLYGDLGGLAPTDLHIGSHDILYPYALLFHEQANAAGSDVELNTCKAGLHIYPLTPTPEGRAATRSIIDSLRVA